MVVVLLLLQSQVKEPVVPITRATATDDQPFQVVDAGIGTRERPWRTDSRQHDQPPEKVHACWRVCAVQGTRALSACWCAPACPWVSRAARCTLLCASHPNGTGAASRSWVCTRQLPSIRCFTGTNFTDCVLRPQERSRQTYSSLRGWPCRSSGEG